MDCIFCKIVNGEIPSLKVYEDEYVDAWPKFEGAKCEIKEIYEKIRIT